MASFLRKIFRGRSEQDRMYAYLSQATDAIHLETLQRQWDRMSHGQRSNW